MAKVQKPALLLLSLLISTAVVGSLILYGTSLPAVLRNPLSECIRGKARDAGEFVPGTLLLTLPNDEVESVKSDIAGSYGLTVGESIEFLSSTTLSVKVPQGKEIELACRLEADSRISSVNLNKVLRAL